MFERYRPLAIVLGLVLLPAAFVGIAERLFQQELPSVGRGPCLGFDYACYYEASVKLMAGGSPYEALAYVTPPPAAFLGAPLALLGQNRAALVVFFLSLVALPAAYTLVCRQFFEPDSEEASLLRPAGMLALLFGYPFLFLLDRGNIDAFVVLLLAGGLVVARRRERLGGLLLGAAAGLKLYPALILLPLLIFRRRRVVEGLLLGLAVAVLASPGLWKEFLTERLVERLAYVGIRENASLASLFLYAGSLVDGEAGVELPRRPELWVTLAYGLYAVLLAMKATGDWRARDQLDEEQKLARTFLYWPFMVAIPKGSFQYTLVILIPLIPVVLAQWRQAQSKRDHKSLRLTAAGIGLGQFPAHAMEKMTGSLLPQAIPAAGLLTVMIGAVLLGWRKVP